MSKARRLRSILVDSSSILALVLSSGLAVPAGAQCTPDPDLPKWFCELPLWLREQPSLPGAAISTNLDHLGASCAGWGDFNGDGHYDIVVGGQQKPFDDFQGGPCNFPANDQRRDKSWIVLGTGGVPCTPPCNFLEASPIVHLGDTSAAGRGERLGWRVAFLGDIDGNPLTNEIAISAPMADHNGDGNANSGVVYVIAAGGPLDLVNLQDPLASVTGSRVIAIRSMGQDDWFGFSISSAGNVIGNSIVDLVIGAPGGSPPISQPPHKPPSAGSAYIIDGAALRAKFASSSFLLGTTLEMNLTQPLEAGNFVQLGGATFYAPGPSEGARFGTSVCAIGNPDLAGRNTIAVGAIESWHNCTSESFEFLSGQGPGFSNGRGRVFVFAPGSAANELNLVSMIGGAAVGDWFGYAVSGLSAVPGSPGRGRRWVSRSARRRSPARRSRGAATAYRCWCGLPLLGDLARERAAAVGRG
jgi:hypothetical protein